MSTSHSTFEALVVQALDDLPDVFLAALDNVEVVIEPEPQQDDRRRLAPSGGTLLGLYEGVPQTRRASGYGLVAPDKITIFEGPIRRASTDDKSLQMLVQRTVIHEIAHHFGISDDRLRELGAY
ncbi:MAG TPA: metallopeptidase family protein [Nitrolancea sp.]|nr:metallopeptidase family protein [Nitrolancea sp.]